MALDALVLRYSDVEASTIAKHLEVMAARGSVWWGWWRKAYEEMPIDVLRAASELSDIRVGLVNRRDGDYAMAHCTELRISIDGGALPSPDRELTPGYYRDDVFPAWFRFDQIEPLSEERWRESFLGPPRGDATLFWIEGGELRFLGDGETETMADLEEIETITAPGDSILHLSDLHYGDDHGFPVRGAAGDGPQRPTMVEAILERVRRLEESIGIVVVSGDLTTKSNPTPLTTIAAPELEHLLDGLGLGIEHLVIIPGNHDIPLDDNAAEATRSYRHELPFRNFLSGLYGERNREIERLTTFETPSGWRLNTATLNSVRLRSAETKDYGYVGPRARPLMEDLRRRFGNMTTAELWSDKIFNLTVLHHHLVTGELITDPAAGRPVSVTLDAGKLIADLQEGTVHAVLHGHQHVPFIGTVSRGRHIGTGGWDGYRWPLWLIGGGSAGAGANRLLDEMRDNTFGIYRPEDEGFVVQMERFNPRHDGETYLRTRLCAA